MFLVGVTGGIASGKSTVSQILKTQCGCTIVDADQISRDIFQPNEKAYKNVVDVFGPGILDGNNEINRSVLGDIIFNDISMRKKLNSITHKEIRSKMLWQVCRAFLRGDRFVVLDVPLLIETRSLLSFLKHIVVVYVNDDVQVSRLMERDGLDNNKAIMRIKSQMPLTEKLSFATKVIDNNGSKENTHRQVHDLFKVLKQTCSLNIYEILILSSGCLALFYYIFNITYY